MPVKGCESYVWFTDKSFGESSNGRSYFGRNKVTGLPCVIKLPKENIKINEKLKKLNNKNVVKLLSTEHTKYKELVIAFEFCDEYCMLKLLQKPENFYGLNDNNIIHLLEDVTSGLEVLINIALPKEFYLKLSNILCAREWDGNITFKISDYLFESHADVYCINALHKKVNTLIWSFGSILCHAILGKSPFESIEQGSSEMINSKREDHIFISNSKEWQSSFPYTVQLTPSLQNKLIDIIKDYLSFKSPLDFQRLSNFKIRSSVTDSIGYAFNISGLSHLAIVVRNESCTFIDNSVSTSKKLVFNQMIYENITKLNPFKERISIDDPAFFYICRAEVKVIEFKRTLDEIYGDVKKITSDDVYFARSCNAFVIFCLRLLDKIVLSERGMKHICNALADEASIKLDSIKLKLTALKLLNTNLFRDLLSEYEIFRYEINRMYTFDTPDQETIVDSASKCSDSGIVMSRGLLQNISSQVSSSRFECCGILKELVERTSKVYNEFLDDSNKELTHNDLQVHKYEKAKLKEHSKKAYQLLDDQLQNLVDVARQFNAVIDEVHSKCKPEVMDKFDQKVSQSILRNKHVNTSKIVSKSLPEHRECLINNLNSSIDELHKMADEFVDILDKFA